jgi:hypothetical protein
MPNSDFNGDGRDDLLWRNDNGMVGYWFGEATGGFTINATLAYAPLDWLISGSGDFNGDGRDDILWRHDNGTVGYWFGQTDGSFTVNSKVVTVPLAWTIAGTGDFNGDGRDDILWRNEDGRIGTWLGQQDGSFQPTFERAVSIYWYALGVGDFNGDDRSDILWWDGEYYGTWTGSADGGFDINPVLTRSFLGGNLIGDFDGDGRDDFVVVDQWSWYNVMYSMPDGRFDPGEYNPFGDASSGTTLRSVRDYNGDGQDEPLFRRTDGAIFLNGDAIATVPTSWHISQDPVDWWQF